MQGFKKYAGKLRKMICGPVDIYFVTLQRLKMTVMYQAYPHG